MCGSAGTDQLRDDGKRAETKKTSKGVGSRGAGVVEAVGSRTDVGRLGSRFGILRCDEEAGEAMRGDSAGGAGAASCFLGPEL